MTKIKKIKGLYVIVDPEHILGRSLHEMCDLISSSGANIIQLRSKIHDDGDLLNHAKIINSICKKNNTLFIINDNCSVASLSGADGVHVGRTDLPIKEAKMILKDNQIVGNSNATLEEIQTSSQLGVDYIAVGSIFITKTKKNTIPSSIEIIQKAKDIVTQPIVAIGGINLKNIKQITRSGADAFCVASSITKSKNPEKVIYEMKQFIN
tara:strand:- start:445 stop:1071 length:627 start_codon:yes stop_codon:yes gene_type:complete